jgi:predicted DNA binding CopG/RHH family protein
MKKFRLTKEEKRIENALMKGEYVKVTGKRLEEIEEALAARKKDYVMTIRVSSQDIKKIKEKAQRIGIRYQTFISELLHQVAQ